MFKLSCVQTHVIQNTPFNTCNIFFCRWFLVCANCSKLKKKLFKDKCYNTPGEENWNLEAELGLPLLINWTPSNQPFGCFPLIKMFNNLEAISLSNQIRNICSYAYKCWSTTTFSSTHILFLVWIHIEVGYTKVIQTKNRM